jgi:hypothetical protein
LVAHDDASSYIPAVSSVFRYSQSYRASDVAGLLLRTERDICKPDAWVLEGGVWQTERVLAVTGGRFISAKGRPNQKLVESYFNRLWKRMSLQRGDVGRHRGEMRKVSDLYVACRAGRKDPREFFMSLDEAQAELYSAIEWLNDKLISSDTYGKWVPTIRWNDDMSDHVRTRRSEHDLWLAAPVAAQRMVRRQSVKIHEEGPLGIPMDWHFAAPWLADYEGRNVVVYFDPMDSWPVTAHITLPESRKLLGTAECLNPIGESRDRAVELVSSIRRSMMSEYRAITSGLTERSVRTPSGTGIATIPPRNTPDRSQVDHPAERTTPHINHDDVRTEPQTSNSGGRDITAVIPQPLRSAFAERARDGGATSADISHSLDRKAARARQIFADNQSY